MNKYEDALIEMAETMDSLAYQIDRFEQLVLSEYKLPVKYRKVADEHINIIKNIITKQND